MQLVGESRNRSSSAIRASTRPVHVADSSAQSARVGGWPGIELAAMEPGNATHIEFRFGRREIGHLHGDHALHIGFPRKIGSELLEQGRVGPHPVFPDNPGIVARRIENDADVADAIALLRINYDRVLARYGLPSSAAA